MAIYAQENILPSVTVNTTLPVDLKENEKFLFKNALHKQLPAVQLYHFKDINVTPHGILFNGFYIYSQFLIWKKHAREFNTFYLLRNYLRRKKKATDPKSAYIICFDYWSMGYFHWLCDFLPRLALMEEHLKTAALLLPQNHDYPYVRESLTAFGIHNVLWFSEDEYVHCHQALVPGYVAPSGDINPGITLKIRTRFMDHYKPQQDNQAHPQNIYVSRAKAKGRFVQNEEEVVKLLAAYGFKTVYFEDHTFAEQVNLAFNCKNLVGLHGANLTNILFMQPKANVLELRIKGDDQRNYYFSLASACDLHYFYLPCETISRKNEEMPDFNVNIAALKAQVESMVANQL
jgi:capsular polysaccharide biosynthesis protein